MVQLMRSGGRNLRPDPEAATIRDKFPVKLEIEDSSEEEHGPRNKRSKSSTPFNEWSTGNNEFPVPPSQYNPLDEPSPLGLRLRKSPSLLDLIQMRLSQGNASSVASAPAGNLNLRDKKDVKETTTSATTDKLKASNFPALLLKIGHWEYVSRFEGDLVAKCYFAKHKLVWEILEGGLKSKLEIQWSDIMALKANCPDDGPGTLNATLARPPLFFKETNPQPRKHTLWQATADFTDGQASIHRQHFLRCAQGLLNKHYEKLIQCDMRLNLVSRQPDMVLDSPYFEARGCVFKDPNESTFQEVDQLETAKRSAISSFQDMASLSTAQSSSLKDEEQNSVGITSEHLSPEASSPSSVIDLCAVEGNGSHGGDGFQAQQDWEQLKVSCLHPSMSMSDLVNHIGHRISERMASGNSQCSEEASDCQDMLENIAHILLSDTQFTTASDEKKLMSRVNSLCCLLQDPATAPNVQVDRESHHPSMSMSDLVNHIGHRISERMASGNSRCSEEASECQDMLENIARILLSDTQFATASDEKKLMSRVNSLCCLLQDPVAAPNVQVDSESHLEGLDDDRHIQGNYASQSMRENKSGSDFGVPGESSKDVPSCKQAPAMSRKDSFGDLLLNLPRIASLPKFLFDISEDDENQAG